MMLFGRSIAPPIKFIFNAQYNADHHREYTKSDLEYVVENSGFKIIYSQIVDTISGVSLRKRTTIKKRSEKESQLNQMSRFALGWNPFNIYDWLRIPLFLACRIFPGIRDTLFIVGQKQ